MAEAAVGEMAYDTSSCTSESGSSEGTCTSTTKDEMTASSSWEGMTAAQAKARLMDDANQAIDLYAEPFLKETRRHIDRIFAIKGDCREFSQHPVATDVEKNLLRARELLDQGYEPSSRHVQSLLPDRALVQALRVSSNGGPFLAAIVQHLFSLGEMHLLMPPWGDNPMSTSTSVEGSYDAIRKHNHQVNEETNEFLDHVKDQIEETVKKVLIDDADAAIESNQAKLYETYNELEMTLKQLVDKRLSEGIAHMQNEWATASEVAAIKEDPRWARLDKLVEMQTDFAGFMASLASEAEAPIQEPEDADAEPLTEVTGRKCDVKEIFDRLRNKRARDSKRRRRIRDVFGDSPSLKRVRFTATDAVKDDPVRNLSSRISWDVGAEEEENWEEKSGHFAVDSDSIASPGY